MFGQVVAIYTNLSLIAFVTLFINTLASTLSGRWLTEHSSISFFDKNEIDECSVSQRPDRVDANVFMNRVTNAIRDKFVYTPDYEYSEKVDLNGAEEFMLKMYQVLKEME